MTSATREWIVKSEADFCSMEWEFQAASATVNFDAVVFHAQQCIEKLMKGALVEVGIVFPRTHELNILAHLIVQGYPSFHVHPGDLAALQPGAVLLRYPGYSATKLDAQQATAACGRIRTILLSFL